jgi:hypothetical protein
MKIAKHRGMARARVAVARKLTVIRKPVLDQKLGPWSAPRLAGQAAGLV